MNPRTSQLLGEEEVMDKFGVPPSLLPELSALMGDR
jgi:5'-3' exonuclease